MKNNILNIRSLFILQLIASSFILSMETTNNTNSPKEESNTETFAFNELRNRFETNTKDTLTASTSTTPEIIPTDSSEQTNTPPVQQKWLSMSEGWKYYTSSNDQVVTNVITQLTKKTFDVTHSRHLEILEKALETTITTQDRQSTETILTLCTDYSPRIMLSDHITQETCNLFSKPYLTELSTTNTTLQNLELINQYNHLASKAKELQGLIHAFQQTINNNTNDDGTYLSQQTEKIENLARPLAALSKLNEKNKEEITKLLDNNTIQKPIKNKTFDTIMPEFLKGLDSELGKIPALPKLKTTPVILAITKK